MKAPWQPGTIVLDDVTVFRSSEDGTRRPVIEGLSLSVEAGTRWMLAGPNGAGKTSVLMALVGALPFTGRIEVAGTLLNDRSLVDVRKRVGFVFANPDEQLFCDSVEDEVGFGPGQRGLEPEQVSARVSASLESVHLAGYESRNPHQLSLGEQRRVAAAAALATHPEVMVFDEPTASLDPVARAVLLDALESTGATLLMASHDLGAAVELGAQVALLNRGRLVAAGPARDLTGDDVLMVRAGLKRPSPDR
jgi:cobalt/nickel transport system ATP-binding protein